MATPETPQLGDWVYTKTQKGRSPDAGRIVALLDVGYFEKVMCHKPPPGGTWDLTTPEWRRHPLAMVFYEDPQRTMTLEEWVNAGVEQGYDEDHCEVEYDEFCPTTQQVVFPLQDLTTEDNDDDEPEA